jgi:glycogen phosphorylase
MSLIEDQPSRKVRMAHLAVVGTHSTNGVAKIHSDLLRTSVLSDFAEMIPERFNNKTNGVTPRRWLQQANPSLSRLITEAIGDDWVTELDRLRDLNLWARMPTSKKGFAGLSARPRAALSTGSNLHPAKSLIPIRSLTVRSSGFTSTSASS